MKNNFFIQNIIYDIEFSKNIVIKNNLLIILKIVLNIDQKNVHKQNVLSVFIGYLPLYSTNRYIIFVKWNFIFDC